MSTESTLNILLLSQFFSTTKGGGEHVFSVIAKKLAKENHKVWLITNNVKDEKYPDHSNIKIITVPPTLQYKGGLPPKFSDNISYAINATIKGLQIIKKEKVHIIHSNNFAPALVGSTLSCITHTPHITTIHDVFSLCGKNYWKMWGRQSGVSKLNVILAPFFEKFITRLRHDCVHTVSNATKNDLIKFGEKKPIHIIENTIEKTDTLERQQNRFMFIHIGRFVFYKNIEVIIKAIKIVKEQFPQIRLVLVGGGPNKESLQKLVQNLGLESNIEFVGYITAEKKYEFTSESNALLFPSLCEGFGLVILEAFSQKRPVLASNIPPMADIIEHGKTGYLIDPHDPVQWAQKIIALIKEPSISQSIGQEGYKTLQEKYNQEIFYQKLVKMYQSIL